MTAGRGTRPRRLLMTVDAVGGVWRYAMDLAGARAARGDHVVLAGLGPPPTAAQRREAERVADLVWLDLPLDWMAAGERDLAAVPDRLAALADRHRVDCLHLNLPSQAAGLDVAVPVLVVSHSCPVTWFAAVRGGAVPEAWQWHRRVNRAGFDRADAVVAPSRSHAAMLEAAYGPVADLRVVSNASRVAPQAVTKESFVFAAGRWWDEGKNGTVLDAAAARSPWPVIMAGAAAGPNGQAMAIRHADHRGELPHADAMALMRRAAVVASPSRYEPFGLAALEAARTGAALLLADIPTYRELWDGAAAFADPDDPGAFAAAIARLATDPQARAALASRAQDRSRRFTVEAQAAAMGALYEAIGRRGPAAALPSLAAME